MWCGGVATGVTIIASPDQPYRGLGCLLLDLTSNTAVTARLSKNDCVIPRVLAAKQTRPRPSKSAPNIKPHLELVLWQTPKGKIT